MKKVLVLIVFSQFCCTSLWFAGNGIMNDLLLAFNLDLSALGHLTSAVQLGFISGTLLFAFLGIADRFSPSKVFFVCAIFGAAFNLAMLSEQNNFQSLMLFRLLTGFSLAGIYPVGMKIASDYYREGLGSSLGFLVGALVLGTAFPHLLKSLTGEGGLPWEHVIGITSGLACLGGLLILIFVPDGPFRVPKLSRNFSAFFDVFRIRKFRAAAFGYFGHMWELYAFWAFVPVILKSFELMQPEVEFNIPLLSFFIIGIGSLSCVVAGLLSRKFGSKATAATALFLSGVCCVLSPFMFMQTSENLLIGFMLIWGIAVVADSPLFSTLVAQNAPEESRGTALTIVNSIGFAISVLSIQLVNGLLGKVEPQYFLLILAVGPTFGLLSLFRNGRSLAQSPKIQ